VQVAKARAAFGIMAPAITGNPDFERVFRVRMNTLQWPPISLPVLWLFAIHISDAIAVALSLVRDRRPHPFHGWLLKSCQQARARLCGSCRRHLTFSGLAQPAQLWRLVHA